VVAEEVAAVIVVILSSNDSQESVTQPIIQEDIPQPQASEPTDEELLEEFDDDLDAALDELDLIE